uniref:Odorant receptor n=1 Tax=Streltzoviella insularis TaxID=1206366 RepID=A0A7D5YY28_9NEOP|nr:odorant receptor 7 [Streltzoviella insularis]
MENTKKVQPFDALSVSYKILILCGFFKLMRPTTRFKYICFQIYRPLSFLIVLVFIVQHSIYAVMKVMDNELDKALDAFIVIPPELNLLSKFLALNLHSSTVDKLNDVMRDSIFDARNQEDEIILTKFVSDMHQLTKNVEIGMVVAEILYILSPIFKRIYDPASTIASYYPFKVDNWGRHTITLLWECSFLPWIGNGHLSLDCLIGIYYSQATTQLKLIKYNLEHLFDSDERNKDNSRNMEHQYIDVVDNTIQERFEHYVERYSKVKWYIQELHNVFSGAIIYQFASTIIIACPVIYKISFMDFFSVQCIYLTGYLIMLEIQIVLYCYYGGLVEYESISINDSLYMSEWLSASPKFRRQMLIAMAQWSRPLTPRVFAIVPLSLNTVIAMLKFIYSLYTALISTNNIN